MAKIIQKSDRTLVMQEVYYQYKERLSPEQYAQEVIKGHIIDPTLTPILKNGLRPIKVLREYLPDEEASNCALLFQWSNPNL